ncbi:hypothetical protein KL930_004826 [Ogataea haglerorum]|uniref:inositol-3-phosphate synthase n=1 Tax=Ogataea haglerorum TaxID=1937702 RepID=A0ABQ7RBM4_9ASCO|nr:hypothetical protein KL951_004628 [Ogataea haglerorum]KAG7703332.1 hypothetical protein KL914_004717 [Ogataea haglerorum]KAG7703820.1 hypothetical protein KL950_004617 [Ogataea haglerorum]KAG7735625.1 hypothetical protein KL932_004289 [Ogataea haglerorum]KAG7755046.1 hypothetical protein KL947_004540 [Ogataea haglerorum]
MWDLCRRSLKHQNKLSKRGSSETRCKIRSQAEPNISQYIPAAFRHHVQHESQRVRDTPVLPIRGGSVLLFTNQLLHTFPIRSQTYPKSVFCGCAAIVHAHAVGRVLGGRGCSTAKISSLGNLFSPMANHGARFSANTPRCAGQLLGQLQLISGASHYKYACLRLFGIIQSIMTVQFVPQVKVQTDKTKFSESELVTNYVYKNAIVDKEASGSFAVKPFEEPYQFKVDLKVPKVGVMLVGLGGNNGTTFVASVLANKNKLQFHTKEGLKTANYYGSVTQSSTIKLGIDSKGQDVYAPFNSLLPMVNPNDFVVGGWDINGDNLAAAMQKAQVLEYDLQEKLKDQMKEIVPLKSIYYPDFIAANQDERANNCFNRINGEIQTTGKWSHVETIRKDIRNFKAANKLDKVIVLWTANTERYADVVSGVNDTAENLLESIKKDHEEIAPSTVFAVASILEHVPYVNGSPQNTFVPGVIELAEQNRTYIGGDDFKSGQTKLKSVLAQFLVDAGIRPVSIASYNHLGNNDGYNLSSPRQFRSKEISKASVVDDVIASNEILYNDKLGKKIDHCIVIKYLNAVGDSKVAMDEYYSELMLGGHNRISIHNVCEDSLLATPLIIDLLVMTEFLSRVTYKKDSDDKYADMYSVLSFLSYWLKAPLTRPGYQAINGLNKQRQGLDNFLRILIGLEPLDELRFEERLV